MNERSDHQSLKRKEKLYNQKNGYTSALLLPEKDNATQSELEAKNSMPIIV